MDYLTVCVLIIAVMQSVKLREAYSVMDEKFEELTNKIDSYLFKDHYNDMCANYSHYAIFTGPVTL